MPSRHPRSYWEASRILFYRQQQSWLIQDDLTLRFVRSGVAVFYARWRIVLWHESATRIILTAAGPEGGETTPTVVGHIARFIPRGYHVKYVPKGRMLVHWPDGQTRLGNKQRIDLVTFYDPF